MLRRVGFRANPGGGDRILCRGRLQEGSLMDIAHHLVREARHFPDRAAIIFEEPYIS